MKNKKLKHGMSNTPLYGVLKSLKGRCYNIKDPQYSNYGGRGITVCEDWRNSYKNFIDWAIENGYQKGLSIDRVDNDGNYEPNNCRWVKLADQQNNKRSNVKITAFGETKILVEWVRDQRCKVSISQLSARIMSKITPEEAITKQSLKNQGILTAFGETKDTKAWSNDPRCSVDRKTISYRLKKGMPVEEAITLPARR